MQKYKNEIHINPRERQFEETLKIVFLGGKLPGMSLHGSCMLFSAVLNWDCGVVIVARSGMDDHMPVEPKPRQVTKCSS